MLAGGIFSSCDMNLVPHDTLDDQTAIQTVNDCERFRNGLYISLRSITSGAWINNQEIQMDLFHGVIGNGNQVGTFANGNILSSDQDIESFWASIYSVINSANYIINKMDAMENVTGYTEEQMTALKRYNAEAHFVRAYCYYWLADHFCQSYSAENANAEAQGIPLVTVYNPTSDRSSYPGRSTQAETYKLIEDDLAIAYTGMKNYETAANEAPAQNSFYLNTNTVLALQARIALTKGEYSTALTKAETVINSGIYTLTTMDKYAALWSEDMGTEVIFRPFRSSVETGSTTGGSYYLTDNEESAYYIPTNDVLELYDMDNDVRFATFFTVYTGLKSNGLTVAAFMFNKYPGNESLKTGVQRNFINMMKPFRLSELYLIAAEAAFEENNSSKANKYLNDLRAQRIAGYENESLSVSALRDAIRTERLKELLGEGFRLSDLRRWNEGFTRNGGYPMNPQVEDIFISSGVGLSYQPGDHRFVWPIPATELQSNPQLEGQQNPGY